MAAFENSNNVGGIDDAYDYSFVDSYARIAVYDDLLSSPQIIEIAPNTTREYITELASSVYEHAQRSGGSIPFSIILQVAENFIHSRFREVVVSIMDNGDTIRFADQGPGISDKEKAQQPGFSSATSDMKKYIHGVGSGLPIVREYMETKNGIINIEDNMDTGAVITISLENKAPNNVMEKEASKSVFAGPFPSKAAQTPVQMAASDLTDREKSILRLFTFNNIWGVKDISDETDIPQSSTHNELKKLTEAGIMAKVGRKYSMTELGANIAEYLFGD